MKVILFILLIPIISFGQTGIVKGNVSTRNSKEIIAGATIFIKGTAKGAATDFNGNYEIKNVSQGKHIIRCSYIGAKPQVDTIEVRQNDSVVIENFSLEQDKDHSKNIIITKQKGNDNLFIPIPLN